MQAVPLFKRRTKASNANGREPKGPAARRNKNRASQNRDWPDNKDSERQKGR